MALPSMLYAYLAWSLRLEELLSLGISNMKFKEKIKELGGISEHPNCDNHKVKLSDILELEEKIGFEFPEKFKEFQLLFGSFAFNFSVEVKAKDAPPIAEDDMVSVNFFLSGNSSFSECSILKVLSEYAEELANGYIPFCDGSPGDLICISLNKKGYGSVYYWAHEESPDSDLYKISNSFEDFVFNLTKIDEDESDEDGPEVISMKLSPKFLEMLKRDGYGPKET